MSAQIIVALDGISLGKAVELAQTLKDYVWGFKLTDLLIEHGVGVIEKLSRYGHVMVDLKFFDIPNTVRNSVLRLEKAGANIITAHATGGQEMLQAAREIVTRAKVVGVTVLTSWDDQQTNFVYKTDRHVICDRFVKAAIYADLHGIVCPVDFLPFVPSVNNDFLRVVPGFRPDGLLHKGDDQKYLAKATDLKLATHVVIGRPITTKTDPVHAAETIKASLDLAYKTTEKKFIPMAV